MGILRADRVSGLGGANAITGSVDFSGRSGPSFLRTISDDFAVGTGDFTVEAWYYRSAEGSHSDAVGNIIVQTGSTATGQNGIWMADAQGKLEGRVHYGSGSWNLDITSSTTMSDNTWYHVAMSRSGSAVKIFIDGALEASGSSSSDLTTAYSNEAYVGAQGNSPGNRGVNGYVSNARISNTALYTAAFTAPTERLEKLSSTILLCCQSPGNILQEATGKSFIVYKNNINDAGPVASHFAPDIGENYGTTFEDNTKFDTLSYLVPPGGTTAESNRGRGLIGGGNTGSATNNIAYVQIQSTGNAVDFGDLTNAPSGPGGVSSSTRGIFAAGAASPTPNGTDVIQYITIATTANAIDFGNLLASTRYTYGGSNNTRGIYGGGNPGPTNVIQYITIASAGNATDFGDLTAAKGETGATSSTIRCLWGGGTSSTNVIEYVTIATTGNAADFGDLTQGRLSLSSTGSTTRAVFGGGYVSAPNTFTNTIDYVTIASAGNAADFGDLTQVKFGLQATSNSLRGIFCGGQTPTFQNTIGYVTISSTGNAADFGDLFAITATPGALSDSHGGIS